MNRYIKNNLDEWIHMEDHYFENILEDLRSKSVEYHNYSHSSCIKEGLYFKVNSLKAISEQFETTLNKLQKKMDYFMYAHMRHTNDQKIKALQNRN